MRTEGLSEQQQDGVWAGFRAGESLSGVARHQGTRLQNVQRFLAQTGGIRPVAQRRSGRQLSAADREEISRGLAAGASFRVIAAGIGRPHPTVTREVARNGGRDHYRATVADAAAFVRGRRPKASKLAACEALRGVVEAGLAADWSPQQVSRRLRLDHPDDPTMRVSHETIYLSLFQPGRRALRRGLCRHLRTRRVLRLPKRAKQSSGRGHLRGMTLIGDRPAEVATRSTPGHWEAVPVAAALTADLIRVPLALRRTLTWDRGREMAEHATVTAGTGCPVYFCDPASPWQRGSNENANRLHEILNVDGFGAVGLKISVYGHLTHADVVAGLTAAVRRGRVVRGHHRQLNPSQEIHALRTLRSSLHGFVTLEAAGRFTLDTDIDQSFTWMVTLIDHGLRSATTFP